MFSGLINVARSVCLFSGLSHVASPHARRRQPSKSMRFTSVCAASASDDTPAPVKDSADAGDAAGSSNSNSNSTLPTGALVYKAPSGGRKLLTSLALMRAFPWRKFKKGSMLVIEVRSSEAGACRRILCGCMGLWVRTHALLICCLFLSCCSFSIKAARVECQSWPTDCQGCGLHMYRDVRIYTVSLPLFLSYSSTL